MYQICLRVELKVQWLMMHPLVLHSRAVQSSRRLSQALQWRFNQLLPTGITHMFDAKLMLVVLRVCVHCYC